MRRGSQAHGQLSLFGRDNGQNFQCPPPLIACRTYYFLKIEALDSSAENSHTQHMILRHIAATAPALLRHVWTGWIHRLERMLGSTAEVPIVLVVSMGSKKPVIRLHALAASASHVLQRDVVPAMQRMRDVCLAGVQGVLCANSKPWPVQPCEGKDPGHSYRGSCTRLPTG
jgi:hypothetical protein